MHAVIGRRRDAAERRLGAVRAAMRPRGPQPPLGRMAIASLIASALAFVVFLIVLDGARLPLISQTFEVRARFADAAGLRTANHSPVTVAGIELGRVESVKVEDGVAVATLSMDAEAEDRIPADSKARIVPRSALQDLTVEIEPGHAKETVSEGETLAAAPSAAPVGTDRVLSVLDADTRAQAQILLAELGRALEGRGGEIAADLAKLGDVVSSSTAVAEALAERRKLLTRFVDELDVIFTRLAERRGQLGGAIDAGRELLATTAARAEELGDALDSLPTALANTRGALDSLERLAGPLEPALAELRPAARALPGALGALQRIVPEGERLVTSVAALGERGAEGAQALRGVLERLGPASEEVRPAVPDAARIVSAVDKNKEGIGVLGDRFSGVFSVNDANGPILRGLGFFETPDPVNLGFGPDEQAKANRMLARALRGVCEAENAIACLVRYLIPSLPGAVREEGE